MSKDADGAKWRSDAPKPYQKPTLIKGPVLSSVTAASTVSGIRSGEQ
jgi:hypothetical protein